MPTKGCSPDKISHGTVMDFLCKEKKIRDIRDTVEKMERHLSTRKSLKLSAKEFPRQQITPVLKRRLHFSNSKFHQPTPISLFGGKDKSERDKEGSAWKSLENAIECFGKDQSIEDVLRQQIEKQEFYDDGSRGGKPPRQGGGGGGDSGGGEDDGHSDETLQVVLGTLGFILLYVFIITGEELARLAKDYIKYLFGGNKSVRLRKAMYEWGRFFGRMTQSWEMDPYLEGEGDHL
ncbi:hypothetical protein SAY87_030276 [Trapa incisa]|uniref:Glycine-rich protein n=1 Tax=Trapa incisa TaxID=236973 RepID=A0AAN7QJQ0_9MYRT|nr:hypothetical protein SAY87_030276 [Trapa incisa]